MSGKKRRNLLQHFGFFSISREKAVGKKIIWLQAVSVGEIATAEPVIRELKNLIDEFAFVVSVTTEAGYRRAQKVFPDALEIFYTPFDFYPAISSLMKKVRPAAILIIETGFWPNLIYCGKKFGAVSVLVNGRISEKSFRNHKSIGFFARPLFSMFDLVMARDAAVSGRFKELGVDEGKIISLGDIKYDTLRMAGQAEMETYKKVFSIGPGEKVIMAGNTHEGEEEFMLDVFDELRRGIENLLLIIAPRRLERVPHIEKILREKGKSYVKRSALERQARGSEDVILLDTIGELAAVYFICDAIFVGKSIFPPGGGHSLLEPVAAGKAPFHGPYVQYYEEARAALKEAGLSVELKDKAEFAGHFREVLEDDDKREELAKRAGSFLKGRRGASKKAAEAVALEIRRARYLH
ncbi:MAG: hypothetical protein HZA01_12040 [Nitrospinae bacterium]|nr:hypothetical protein [Nitrospinota bacterium]